MSRSISQPPRFTDYMVKDGLGHYEDMCAGCHGGPQAPDAGREWIEADMIARSSLGGNVMQTVKAILALGFVGAVTVGTIAAANAQYFPPLPPPYSYYGGDRYDGPRHYRDRGNGCPPGYTVQGGNCAPYRGPEGGGWNTWNGCPPGYTVQGGACAPYRGR
jgi:hypothetical protein